MMASEQSSLKSGNGRELQTNNRGNAWVQAVMKVGGGVVIV